MTHAAPLPLRTRASLLASVDVLVCTFRRPSVVETLASVDVQTGVEGVPLRIVVVDNDDTPTARARVEGTAASMRLPVRYIHAPGRNISIARNAALEAATADWVAFLDDDETVAPDWLATLLRRAEETGADAVFGQVHAVYDEAAPEWIRRRDYHSQIRAPKADGIRTGHTCNALLRWRGTPWRGERFDLPRGRSGGEDTEYFYRLNRMGATYAIADDALAFEPVPPERLEFRWLFRRRFRIGQSHVTSCTGATARTALFATAATKALYCGLRSLMHIGDLDKRRFWVLRGTLHAGVCAGCLAVPSLRLYGK